MKIVMNPEYARLSEFMRRICAHDYRSDQMMRNLRNTVEKVTADDGTQLVVKRFVKPDLLRRLIYTFSWSKARRSFEYAQRFEKSGIGTAEPVAYMELYKGGIFHTGYYVTLFMPYEPLTAAGDYPLETYEKIIRDLAHFTARMHRQGITHRDYNPTNIFFRKEGAEYRFWLVDINRARFGRVSKKRCVLELSRLGALDLPAHVAVCEQYALARGWDPERLCAIVLMDRHLNLKMRVKKLLKPFKRIFGMPRETAQAKVG